MEVTELQTLPFMSLILVDLKGNIQVKIKNIIYQVMRRITLIGLYLLVITGRLSVILQTLSSAKSVAAQGQGEGIKRTPPPQHTLLAPSLRKSPFIYHIKGLLA